MRAIRALQIDLSVSEACTRGHRILNYFEDSIGFELTIDASLSQQPAGLPDVVAIDDGSEIATGRHAKPNAATLEINTAFSLSTIRSIADFAGAQFNFYPATAAWTSSLTMEPVSEQSPATGEQKGIAPAQRLISDLAG